MGLGFSIYNLDIYLTFLFGFVAAYVLAEIFLVSGPFFSLCSRFQAFRSAGHRYTSCVRTLEFNCRAEVQGRVG